MQTLLIILTVLSSFLANLEQKTLQSDFTVTVSEEVNAPMNYPGTVIMHGDKFRLEMFGLEAAYDGKTMYMYSGETDELTISNPTQEELLEANPFLYAKTLVGVCNTTERASSDNKETIITLTPKDQSIGINRFTLRVRNADLIPLQVDIKEGRKNTTLKMTNPAFVNKKPAYTITPPDADTYINDLR